MVTKKKKTNLASIFCQSKHSLKLFGARKKREKLKQIWVKRSCIELVFVGGLLLRVVCNSILQRYHSPIFKFGQKMFRFTFDFYGNIIHISDILITIQHPRYSFWVFKIKIQMFFFCENTNKCRFYDINRKLSWTFVCWWNKKKK